MGSKLLALKERPLKSQVPDHGYLTFLVEGGGPQRSQKYHQPNPNYITTLIMCHITRGYLRISIWATEEKEWNIFGVANNARLYIAVILGKRS